MTALPSTSCELPPILGSIASPDDLRALPAYKLPLLAQEIRDFLVTSLSVTGGHLGPNLGVVELSIALHSVFHTPKDKILFDVSHQAYIHKMLTGRADKMHSIRQFQGISGFTKRCESVHDAFGAGHAGTALSAALGIAAARDLASGDNHVIAVAGDGAFTCGVTLEALNNVAHTTKKLIVILNDNEWSIDKNVGALAKYFAALQTSDTYTWLRKKAANFVEMLAGDEGKKMAQRLETTAQNLIAPSLLFSKFGLSYYGPIDGHNIPNLIKALKHIKTLNEPVILHIITEKGKGYQPAQDNPSKFHGVGHYDVSDGSTAPSELPSYSEIFGRSITQLGIFDPKVLAITAAMPTGTMLNTFKHQFPQRFFDVGIAEEHAAVFACGLATEGYKPYLAIYSSFIQRCIDMIQHDAALQKLPVRFCMDRAGLSPDDGPTHHGLFDIAMMRCIPQIAIMQAKDEAEFVHMLHTMNAYNDGPSAIRYPRGVGIGADLPAKPQILPWGKAEVLEEGDDIALIFLGSIYPLAMDLRDALCAQGFSVSLINARFVKPLDKECICQYAAKSQLVITMEDHVVTGGFGSAVLEALQAEHITCPVEIVGWKDQFIEQGSQTLLRQKYGLTVEAILPRVLSHFSSK